MVRISIGQIFTGSLFNEPMRVEAVQANGPASWVLGLVGTRSERFRKVTLTAEDIEHLTIIDACCSQEQGRTAALRELLFYEKHYRPDFLRLSNALSAKRGEARHAARGAAIRRPIC